MKTRLPLYVAILTVAMLASMPKAEAYPFCGALACSFPPQDRCSDLCWSCDGDNEGPDYQPYGCARPQLIAIGDLGSGCPCYQASLTGLPSLGLDFTLPAPPLAKPEAPAPNQAPGGSPAVL